MVFQSRLDARGVDRDKCVINGASIVTGGVQAKGYDLHIDSKTVEGFSAMASAKGKLKVMNGHGRRNHDISGVIGTAGNFAMDGPSLRADISLLKSHPATAQLLEMAEVMPGEFGLSVEFNSDTEDIGGKKFVRPFELHAVAVVPEPAANPDGLFSVDTKTKGNAMADDNILSKLKALLGIADHPTPAPDAAQSLAAAPAPQSAAPAPQSAAGSSPPAVVPAGLSANESAKIVALIEAQQKTIEALAARLEAVSAKANDTKLAANRMSIGILAQAGGAPMPAGAAGAAPSSKTKAEEYMELNARNPREAGKFWLANKNEILLTAA
jgi:hypothetical protein